MNSNSVAILSIIIASCGFLGNLLAFCVFSTLPKFQQKSGFLVFTAAGSATCMFTGLNVFAIMINASLNESYSCKIIWYMSYVVPTLGNWALVQLSVVHLFYTFRKKQIYIIFLRWGILLLILALYFSIFYVVDITENQDTDQTEHGTKKCYFTSELSLISTTLLDFLVSTLAPLLIIVICSFFILSLVRQARKDLTFINPSQLRYNELIKEIRVSALILVLNISFTAFNLIIFICPFIFSAFSLEFNLSIAERAVNFVWYLLFYGKLKKSYLPLSSNMAIESEHFK